MNSNKTLQTSNISVDLIKENELNAELGHVTSEEAVNILTQSLATIGLMQPLVVYKDGKNYVLLSGHKRLSAAKKLGWTEIPCEVVAKPKDKDKEQILLFYANQYRNTPEEFEKIVEIAERTWNTMQKELKSVYSTRYRNSFERKFKDNPEYINNKKDFLRGYFSPKCDFIREVTGFSKSNPTVKRLLSSIRDRELGKNKDIDSDEIDELKKDKKTKEPKIVSEKSILKEIDKLSKMIDEYTGLPDVKKNVVYALGNVLTELENAKEALS